jgi:hypothetical protein
MPVSIEPPPPSAEQLADWQALIERILWVPDSRSMSCDLRILMDQPTEPIPSGNPPARRDDR